MKPNVILIGAPGSGKGTQSEKLIQKYSYTHISTGDMLRNEIASSSDLGMRVSSIMSSGNLVDDKTVLELLSSRCQLGKFHYIFDGFPRNIDQAILLDDLLGKALNKNVIIFLKIEDDVVAKRISSRRVCSKCGQVFGINSPVDLSTIPCVKCGTSGTLIQRKDDMPEVVLNRLKVFSEAISPMLKYYESMKRLITIDATLSEDNVFSKISTAIENFSNS